MDRDVPRSINRRRALTLFAGLALCPLCAPRSFAEPSHWGYEGAEGPAKWGDLDAANRACSLGTQQSPINIGDNTIKAQLAPLKITWAKSADTIVNNGHTIQLGFAKGDTQRRALRYSREKMMPDDCSRSVTRRGAMG